MARPPMLIDCDPGLDDAIALLTAAQLTDMVGITTVNGNVGIEHTTHNALAVAQVSGLDIPVHRGAARPLLAPTIDAAYVHGPTGLGTVEIPELDRDVASDDAVGFILDMARSIDDLELVAVGPLTNIALALRRDPDNTTARRQINYIASLRQTRSFGTPDAIETRPGKILRTVLDWTRRGRSPRCPRAGSQL